MLSIFVRTKPSNMFIQNALPQKPNLWKYIIGLIVVVFFWQGLGSIPLIIAMVSKTTDLSSLNATPAGLADLLGANLFLSVMLSSFILGLIGLFLYVKFVHKQSIRSLTTSREKIDWGRIFFSFFVTILFIGGFLYAGVMMEPDSYQWNFNREAFIILAAIVLLMLPLQTSFEEYFFRGYLLQGLGVATNSRFWSLVITSSLFGLMHIFNPEIQKIGYAVLIVYIGLGFLMGIMTLMDEGLELALGFHAANNMTIALMVTTDWSALQTDALYVSSAEPELGGMLLFLGGMFVVLLGIFALRYRWKNWGNKLFGKALVLEEETTA